MFFDDDLLKCEALRNAWLVGKYQNVESEINLQETCQKLDTWIGSQHTNAKRRLSLRTSAVLVDGAARIYKQKMEGLLKAVDELDKEIRSRKRRISTGIEKMIDSSDSPSRSCSTPKQLKHQSEWSPGLFNYPLRSRSTPEQMTRQSKEPPEIISTPITMEETRESSKELPLSDHTLSSCNENSTFTRQTNKVRNGSVISAEKSYNESTDTSEGEFDNSIEEVPRVTDNLRIHSDKDDTASDGSNSSFDDQRPSKSRKTTGNSPDMTDSKRNEGIEADFNKAFIESSDNADESSDKTKGDAETPSQQSVVLKSTVIRTSNGQKTNNNKKQDSRRSTVTRRDQGTQITCPLHSSCSEIWGPEIGNFDKTLPFGYLIIHDSYESRIPSKIVISSLNSNVKHLT